VANNLYYCRIKVSRGADSDLPEGVEGAYVPSFAAAEDHQKALGMVIPGLLRLGWVFEDLVDHRVDEMAPEHWDAFIEATWPGLKDDLPDQDAINELLVSGGSFYGPFSVWGGAQPEKTPDTR